MSLVGTTALTRLVQKIKNDMIAKSEAEECTAIELIECTTENVYSETEIDTLLNTKQDKLPTIIKDKYLHTNSSTGALEWADAGGSTSHLYQHNIEIYSNDEYNICISILNDSNIEFTTTSLSTYLETYEDKLFTSTGCFNNNGWGTVIGIYYDSENESTMIRYVQSDGRHSTTSTLIVISDNVITLI